MCADEYLTPELTETILRRARDVSSGTAECTSLDDLIAEWEKDPAMKACMDDARERIRKYGPIKFEVRPVVLTERGLKVCDVEEANG